MYDSTTPLLSQMENPAYDGTGRKSPPPTLPKPKPPPPPKPKVGIYLYWIDFRLFYRPCSAHAGYIGTDRSLLMGHNALLLLQVARDLLHALSLRYGDILHGLW